MACDALSGVSPIESYTGRSIKRMKLTSSLWRRRNAPSIETEREVENENKILFRPRDYGSNAKAGGQI